MARVGIVGTGWGARSQVPAFRAAGLEVTAIAGRDAARTERVASELGLRGFPDWRELVSAADVDLVSVVTPPPTHKEIAVAALTAHKHVLSEKPMALDAGEALEMVEAAARHPDQLALVDHELRFLFTWRTARERRENAVGSLRFAEVRFVSPGRGDPARPWTWWSDAKSGGGVWGAVGSHFVDALRYFGEEFQAVQAFLGTVVTARPAGGGMRAVTSDDFAQVNARLRGGGLATMLLSVVGAAEETTTLTLHGDHGALRLVGPELRIASPGGQWQIAHTEESTGLAGDSPGGLFGSGTRELGRALVAALDEGDRKALGPAATFEDGFAQQRVLDAARRSHANKGAWEEVR